MLNVVADKDGVGAAVLIRACSPVRGKLLVSSHELMNMEKERRNSGT